MPSYLEAPEASLKTFKGEAGMVKKNLGDRVKVEKVQSLAKG